jgi:hypothetical protein
VGSRPGASGLRRGGWRLYTGGRAGGYKCLVDRCARCSASLGSGGRPGELAPRQRAERDLACVRFAARDGDPAAVAAAFTVAIGGLRQHSSPYHLGHGLSDHAGHLLRRNDDEAAGAAIGEARDIAERLGCQSLLGRAADLPTAEPRIWALMVTAPGPGESAAVRDG